MACCAVQALFHTNGSSGRRRAAELLGHHAPAGHVVVRLSNHAPSQMHIRQLKSSSIGEAAAALAGWGGVWWL